VPGASAWAQTLVNIRTQDAPRSGPHNNTLNGRGHPKFIMGDVLVALDWDYKTVEPRLAKSWAISADKRTYVFRLRDDSPSAVARSPPQPTSSVGSTAWPIPTPSLHSTGGWATSTVSPPTISTPRFCRLKCRSSDWTDTEDEPFRCASVSQYL
jgi:hypothetical protein